MMPTKCFIKIFDSNKELVKPIIQEALLFLCEAYSQISDEDLFDMRTIFHELLFNAIEHGNKCQISQQITFLVEPKGDVVHAVIKDQGNGFDHPALLNQALLGIDMQLEHGRGIHMAMALADSLTFNTLGNEVFVEKRLCFHG